MGERVEADVGARRATEAVFVADHARILAILIRYLGDYDLAEDGLQEAFAEALRSWPSRGIPESPSAWIVTTARNRAIDRLRRAAVGDAKLRTLAEPADRFENLLDDADIPDERLRLIFTGCHPAVARSDAVALTLRTVCGLSTPAVASAFLVKESTMQARITRAKAKIKAAKIPFRVPEHHELPDRLPAVLDVIALIYNQGYTPHDDHPLIDEIRNRAITLAEMLVEHLPDEPEALGCLALLLFHETRQPARLDSDGNLVALERQNRRLWNHHLAARAQPLLDRALRQGQPGPYQLQAAISALHSTAPTSTDTDWPQIEILYRHLLGAAPSPTTQIGQAVAVGMAYGPAAGLDALPEPDPQMSGFHRWHAARADLLARMGDRAGAADSFEQAAALASNPAERRWLTNQSHRLRTTVHDGT
jgi:RNA polymerase sigma-70 factor (ECF subfamily)